jgi:tetraacyldisaccharide 4'-kinase
VPEEELRRTEEQVRHTNNGLLICRAVHAPVAAKMLGEEEINLRAVQGKKTFAFCGIGNPRAFFGTLERLGCVLVGSRSFNDHHKYTDQCLARVHEQARERRADLLLTTQKDWTKIAHLNRPKPKPALGYVIVRLEVVSGATELTALIERALGGKMRSL